MIRGARAAFLTASLISMAPAGAWAFPDDLGARSLAMGQGGRADARGTDALALNPAGMSLATMYTMGADYQLLTKSGGQIVRAQVADSTSAFGLGGGLYYAYRSASPAGAPSLAGHEVGLALSYPFVDRVYLGVTAKYLYVNGGLEPDQHSQHMGVTCDVGLAVRPTSLITFGVAGYNLIDRSTVQAPVSLGYGVAVTPHPTVSVVFDVLHDFTTTDPSVGVRTSLGGGGEVVIKSYVAVRAGGGRDGTSGAGFVSGGLAGISSIGALDASVRQDISGDHPVTTFVFGLRLFVDAPQPDQSETPSSSHRSAPGPSSLPPGPTSSSDVK